MIKIGITGSLASGKSTVAKYYSRKGYPTYSADLAVSTIYKNKKIIKKIKKIFLIKQNKNIREQIRNSILKDKKKLRKIEKIIHPEVRKKMGKFLKKNQKSKIVVCEIPLLIESRLNRLFDFIVFIDAKTSVRLKRYIKKGGTKKVFSILNKRQLKREIKISKSDYVIKNNKSFKLLEKNVKMLTKIIWQKFF